MGWVDEVPRTGGLFIGGLHALYQRQDLFKAAKITHVLSVLDFDIHQTDYLRGYVHMQVHLDDDPNENLLQHFAETNKFIDEALKADAAVFVHCAMGKSRSATVVCAYLMWKHGLSPLAALEQLCEGRPVCSPNPGFMEQLEVYHRMLGAEPKSQSDGIYHEWLGARFSGDWSAWERRRDGSKL